MAGKRTHPLWEMVHGDEALIPSDAAPSWMVNARRIGAENAVEFEFEKQPNGQTKVTCFDAFDREPQGKTRKRHPAHFICEGESLGFSGLDEPSYRVMVSRIEKVSEKRFVFLGQRVMRLKDGSDKKMSAVPKSKYGFGQIDVGSHRDYACTLNLRTVSFMLDRYAKKSGYVFKKEWLETGLRISRTA